MTIVSVINQHLQVLNFSKTLLTFVIILGDKHARCIDIENLYFWNSIPGSAVIQIPYAIS